MNHKKLRNFFTSRHLIMLLTTIFLAALVMGFSLPSTEAVGFQRYRTNTYWCNNRNFPLAYEHMGFAFYVDLKSSYIVSRERNEDGGMNIFYRFNVISVRYDDGKATRTKTYNTMVGEFEDGEDIFMLLDSGNWAEITDIGRYQPAYNATWLVERHLGVHS